MKKYLAVALGAALLSAFAVAGFVDGDPAKEGFLLINLVDESKKNIGGYRSNVCPRVGDYIKTWRQDDGTYNLKRRQVKSVTFVGWQGRNQDVMIKVGPQQADVDWPTH